MWGKCATTLRNCYLTVVALWTSEKLRVGPSVQGKIYRLSLQLGLAESAREHVHQRIVRAGPQITQSRVMVLFRSTGGGILFETTIRHHGYLDVISRI